MLASASLRWMTSISLPKLLITLSRTQLSLFFFYALLFGPSPSSLFRSSYSSPLLLSLLVPLTIFRPSTITLPPLTITLTITTFAPMHPHPWLWVVVVPPSPRISPSPDGPHPLWQSFLFYPLPPLRPQDLPPRPPPSCFTVALSPYRWSSANRTPTLAPLPITAQLLFF